MARSRILTTIGLPVRTELRIKSMLEIIKTLTDDSWSYSQDGVADLAICEPHSALTALAIKRAQSPDSPRCALLVKDETVESALPVIHDPIRPMDLARLLNSASKDTVTSNDAAVTRVSANSAVIAGGYASDNSAFALALELHDAVKQSTHTVIRLHVAGIDLIAVPKAKLVAPSKELDAGDIIELAESTEPVHVVEGTAADLTQLQSSEHRTTIPALLWKLGIFGPRNRFVSLIDANALLKLRRWPDFGRLEHNADHMRLAARLSRQFMDMTQMSVAISQPPEKIRPFLNACALCDLLVAQAAEVVAAPVVTIKAQPESRYKSLFQSIRSALNFSIS
jgi:hypothetical protein